MDDDLGLVLGQRAGDRGVVADVDAQVGLQALADTGELEQRGVGRDLVGQPGDAGAHGLQPQRQP